MINRYLFLCFFTLGSLSLLGQNNPHCGTLQPTEGDYLSTASTLSSPRELYTISVIFHVVWRTEEQNISEEQILSQLEVLNDDFRAANDQSNVPFGFQDEIADAEIEFCLARRLPSGQATSGILRTETEETIIGLKPALYTSSPAVDSEHYLNVWVADLGGGINGIADFPGQAIPEQDGIIIDPRYVGTTGAAAEEEPYHLGRTLTHEIGHYLNLYHVFGTTTSGSCQTDDFVEDTPNSENTYLGNCPSGIEFSCESSDMWMNFMYFTDDACMSMFSQGQKARMQATLMNERAGLTESQGCLPVNNENISFRNEGMKVYPNPAADFLMIENTSIETHEVEICNTEGKIITHISSAPGNTYLDLSTFKHGVYFLQIRGKGAVDKLLIL